MGQAGSLPASLNLIWMCISAITLIGGIFWIVVIFWPLLKEQKQIALRGLSLMEESNASIQKTVSQIEEALKDVDIKKFQKLEVHMEAIRNKIERNVATVKPKRRNELTATEEK